VLDSRDLKMREVSLQIEFERLPLVVAVQLQQVLLNLIKNAVDAMDTVTDRARVLNVKSEVYEPNAVLVSVEDSGTGIGLNELDRIFDAFIPNGSVFQFMLPTL
jgi:signal transduction histidine kinase